jgi:hypothetical protein
VGALSETVRERLIQEIDLALENRRDDGGVVFPIETYVGRARR